MNDTVKEWLRKSERDFATARRVRPDRTHDLTRLGQSLHAHKPTWTWPEEELIYLSRASVDYRCPGEEATEDDAREALGIAERLREALRTLLPTEGLFDRDGS